MTKSQAHSRKLAFLAKLPSNLPDYQIPSAHTFADAAKHYREKFGPAYHRDYQMMGHSSASMTRLYTGEIPLTDVAAACCKAFGTEMENMENGVVS
jgi:hypothetical protein